MNRVLPRPVGQSQSKRLLPDRPVHDICLLYITVVSFPDLHTSWKGHVLLSLIPFLGSFPGSHAESLGTRLRLLLAPGFAGDLTCKNWNQRRPGNEVTFPAHVVKQTMGHRLFPMGWELVSVPDPKPTPARIAFRSDIHAG